jgi:hypothetical protein
MNIKAAVKVLRNMEGDIAEVIAKKGNNSLSYIVYLVSEPSNDDLVKPNLHEWIFGSVDEFEEKFDDETDYDFDVLEFETDFKKDDKIDPVVKHNNIIDNILDNENVWKKFCDFFRMGKGYIDWTDEEIDYSRNDDDFEEFVKWLVEKIDQ